MKITIKLENKNMYELWSVSELGNEVIPLFLIETGELLDLTTKFKKLERSIITTKNGDIVKTHYNG
jgi:hypothetical protein